MSAIRRLRPWVSQPPPSCGLDWSIPLTRGLGLLVPDFSGRDLVGNRLVSKTASLQPAVTQMGRGMGSAGAAGFSATLDLSGTSAITVALIARRDSGDGTQMLAELTANANTSAGSFLAYFDANKLYVGISTGSGSYNVIECSAPAIGRTTKIIFTLERIAFSAAKAARVWYDGIEQATTQPNYAPVGGNFANSTIYFLGRGASSLFLNGAAQDVTLWSRKLDDKEILSWSANPWQIFDPPERRIWAVGEGGGGGRSGGLNATESGSDTFAASAVVQAAPASGALAAAETGADTAVVQASAVATGALAALEQGTDIAAISGKATASGQLNGIESGADTALVTAGVTASGQLNAVETGSDVFAASATAPIAGGGRLQAQEAGADTAAATGSATATGLLLAQEGGADTAIASGFAVASGALAAVEPGPDTAAISAQAHAQVVTQGTLNAVETSADAASAFVAALVSGALACIEAGSDTFAGRESAPPAAPDALYLSIADASTHLSKATGARHLSIAKI